MVEAIHRMKVRVVIGLISGRKANISNRIRNTANVWLRTVGLGLVRSCRMIWACKALKGHLSREMRMMREKSRGEDPRISWKYDVNSGNMEVIKNQ